MILACYLGFLVLSFFAAVSDFLFYRIPNFFVLAILLCVGLKLFIEYRAMDAYLTGLIFITTLAGGYLLYILKIMGPGDAKFLSVSILWMAPHDLIRYLVWVSIAGGLLALFYIFWHNTIDSLRLKIIQTLKETPLYKYKNSKKYLDDSFTSARLHDKWSQTLIPYGVSIFIGSLILTVEYFNQGSFR